MSMEAKAYRVSEFCQRYVISKASFYREVSSHHDWFKHVYEIACGSSPIDGPNSAIRSTPFDELFHIYVLPSDWKNYPYVFYSFRGISGEEETISFRGSKQGKGIAENYYVIDKNEAKTIITLCGQCSPDFRDALPADGTRVVSPYPDNVVPLIKMGT